MSKEISKATEKGPQLTQVVMHRFFPTVNEAIRPFQREGTTVIIQKLHHVGNEVADLKCYRRKVLKLFHVHHPGISTIKGIFC